jgi:chitodextrinase
MFRIEEVGKNTRAGLISSFGAAHIAAMVLVVTVILGPSTASARRPPTPQNFQVTATTAYTVTVTWDPAPPNSGDFNYHLSGAYGVTPAILPKTATSHTFTRLHPGNQYWFFIYARNARGEVSGQLSNTTRTLLDTTTPSTGPVVTVTEVGSNYVSISLTPAQDDCPFLSYHVSVNGDPQTAPSPNLSTTLRFLRPETTYSLTARGRDEGQHWSPFSDPVSVTTLPPNPNDQTPPNTPGVSAYGFGDGSTEMQIQWAQSTDDFDAQSNLRYDVYLNGVLEDVRFGSGGPITAYGVFGENTVEVIASDTPATQRRRVRLPYSYHNRAFQGGAGQEETKETSDGSQSKMEEKQYDWAAFLRLRDSGRCSMCRVTGVF